MICLVKELKDLDSAMFGAYKVGEWIKQIANVISGTSDESDPKYSTPVGVIAESETADNIADLVIGANTKSGGNLILSTMHNVSTVNSGVDLAKEVASSQRQQNIKESETKKAVVDSEEKKRKQEKKEDE